MSRRRALARPSVLAAVAAALAYAPGARADDAPLAPSDGTGAPLPVQVRADEVDFNTRTQAVEARGNVRVDAPPFYLTTDRVVLRRVGIGVELEGEGRLGFCPCLGTPVAVSYDRATVAPPHDVILRSPRLEIFGVPILWAPIFWLRSPARRGLLAPEIAYRGSDGLFLGEGVHLPLHEGTSSEGGLDLRAGGYVKGGAAVDAHLYTATSTTRVRWDRLGTDGVTVDARGATAIRAAPSGGAQPSVAWDVDVVRGVRGVVATTDVDAAARPFDRAAFEGAWRAGGWTVASSVRSVAQRGGDVLDLGAVGPIATVRRAEAIGGAGAYDATIDGGVVRGAGVPPLSFARGEAGAMLAARVGVVGASIELRGVADVASDGVARGVDAAGSARARLALPLVRGFASRDDDDPWVHRIEPRLDVAALGLRSDGVLGAAVARGASIAPGGAWTATGGVATAVGRWGARGAVELDVAAGVVGDAERTWPAMRERAALGGPWVGVSGEAAHVVADGATGHAVAARARLGRVDGANVAAVVAGRDGVDPIRARALVDAPLEPSSGFLAAETWTGGARVAVPWSRAIVTRGGADADLATGRLVAASGAVELRDRCGCFVVRALGAHRLGRDGVDVWLTVDLPHAL